MAALRMQVGGADVEGYVPAGTAPHDGGEQDLGGGREPLLPRDCIDVRSGAKQPPEPSGVVMNPDLTDRGQRYRPRMSFPNAYQVAARIPSVPESKTVAAAALALTPRESDLRANVGQLGPV